MITRVSSVLSRWAGPRLATCCLLALALTSLGLLSMAAQPPEPTLLISEIFLDPVGANTTQAIELFNAGPTSVSLNGAVLTVGDLTRPLNGLAEVPPGGVVAIRWNQTGTSSGSQFFTGRTTALNPLQGNVALFKSNQLTSPTEMLAYVQWGAARQARAALAEQAGLWDPAAFLPRTDEGQSLTLLPGGTSRTSGEWTAAAPTIAAVNSAHAPGFRGWNLVGGRSIQAPSASFVSDTNRLEIASVAPGDIVQHHRFVDNAWRLIGSPGSAASAALAAGAGGTLEMIAVGADRQLLHSRYLVDQWGSFAPVGVESLQPDALALSTANSITEVVIVGPDNQLRHGRFDGAKWSSFQPVGAASSSAPALAFDKNASRLELLFSGSDRAVYHARFAENTWSEPVSTGGQTVLRPAVAVLPDGSLEAAITSVDGSVRQNRFVNGAWQTWQPIPGLRSDLPPTLLHNPKIGATELFVVGLDRQLRQARRTAVGWSLPVSTAIIAAHPPAAVINEEGTVELLVTGQDGNLWHNRFRALVSGPVMTLSRDVQPIFTASCALVNCHSGRFPNEEMTLEAGKAYANTVGVPSNQAPDLNRVEPGDPQKSYLWHKINGTQLSVGGEQDRMPRDRPALKAADIEKIRLWIEQGAEDN
jgi:hypothetical protein